jgi:hypothetical protein
VIRLLTRLIFIWFIKEKGLVPEGLFDRQTLKHLLKLDPSANPDGSNYYRAILQNLFFATLNVEMGSERRWAVDGGGMKGDRLIHSLYRHKGLFSKPDSALDLFSKIPYLNGGLFECLDRDLTERDFQRNPELKQIATKEGNGWVLRIDGFSRRPEAQPTVPNKLFFDGEEDVDLSEDLGLSKRLHNVDGLFGLFNRYKFTVDENTPIEEEVALDPELLGKVFENLLASYNEDTKTTARKLSGSFYTPREVVDYMVDEALVGVLNHHFPRAANADPDRAESEDLALSEREPVIARLRRLLSFSTDAHDFSPQETTRLIAAIESLKILDPACGSGAFPMGMLAKLVHVLRKLDPHNTLWRRQNRTPLEEQVTVARRIPDPSLREDKVLEAEEALRKLDRDFSNAAHADYTRKLYLIEKCIHGIDIQPIAVQIAKLRFFISLIVSQEVDRTEPNWGITALPNLETKIVAADALTSIDRPKQLPLRDAAIGTKEQELIAANEYYFAARTSKTKRKWRDRIFDLRDDLARLLEDDLFLSAGAAKQLVHWNPFDQNAFADFFDPEWMFQIKDGFDIVIGNPPYVRQEKIEFPPKTLLKSSYECFTGAADLFVYFYERSIKLLRPFGVFAFITSNKWYRSSYGEKLREFMSRNTRLRSIIDFGDTAVFEAIAYPTIIVAMRRDYKASQPDEAETFQALNWVKGPPVESFPAVFAADSFSIPQAALSKTGWQLEVPGKRLLLERLRRAGTPLGEYVNGRFYYGIKTGLNKAFEINSDTRSRLISRDPKSAEIIRPFLRGRDVKRWNVEFDDRFLIKLESSENVSHPWSGMKENLAERIFAKEYPAIHEHLQAVRGDLINRYDQGAYFWELRSCAYWDEFKLPKVILGRFMDKPTYAFDRDGFYLNNALSFIAGVSEFLVAVLNSSVTWWFLKETCTDLQNGFIQVHNNNQFAIVVPDADERKRSMVSLIAIAILNGTANLSRFEQLINSLIFELFFPEELHGARIRLFDALEETGIRQLAALEGIALRRAADELANEIFSNSHVIYAMLFDLQSVDVVRMIEGRE